MLHSGVVVSGTGLQLAPQGVWVQGLSTVEFEADFSAT